jgi:2-polyprenyl-3-methyl-5-hydroxy-6-metoxy-1,4-benzoquinol methylase
MDFAASSHGRFGVLAKRGVESLLRYHTHYQGEINLSFAAFMSQLVDQQNKLTARMNEQDARLEELFRRSDLTDPNLLRDIHTKVNRLTNQADFIAGLGRRIQQLQSRLQADDEYHELQLKQSTELQRLRDELNHNTVSLQTQLGAVVQNLADLESTASSVHDWQQQAEKHLAAITDSLEATTRLTTVEDLAAQLRKVTEDLSAVLGRFAARPYMSSDVYGTAGDLSQPMGFGLDAENAGASREKSLMFEDLFRGSPEFIAERQRVYLPFMHGKHDIVDLGCGRGELLGLLRSIGIEGKGVEMDERLVTGCRGRGLDVDLMDAFEYLEQQPDKSLDVVFSAQVIEHIEPQRLPELLCLAEHKLRRRSLFIAETVNPESYLALKTFYVDHSHKLPIYPQVLLYLCQQAGFLSARIFYPQGGGFTQETYESTGEYAVIALT